jgi:hypothetical protein
MRQDTSFSFTVSQKTQNLFLLTPTKKLIVQFVILLWRGFNHVKILDWNVNKSASRLYINAPRVEQYQYNLQSFTCPTRVDIKYILTPGSSYLFSLRPVLRIRIRIRIRIHRIYMVLGLLYPDLSVRGMDPDPDLDPSITKHK